MKCPACNSTDVERTCQTFKKDEEPAWTGWYCYDCGHWWPIGRMNMKKSYSRSSATDCSTQIKPFSEAWWKIIEANRIEKAHKFGPNADVLSAISTRAMVLDALKWFKLKA